MLAHLITWSPNPRDEFQNPDSCIPHSTAPLMRVTHSNNGTVKVFGLVHKWVEFLIRRLDRLQPYPARTDRGG